jgi:hypothetical protein
MAPLAPLRDSQVRWIWLSKPLSFKWQAHWNTPDPPGAALLFHLFSCFAWFAYEGGRRRDPFSGTCKTSDPTLRRATSAWPRLCDRPGSSRIACRRSLFGRWQSAEFCDCLFDEIDPRRKRNIPSEMDSLQASLASCNTFLGIRLAKLNAVSSEN